MVAGGVLNTREDRSWIEVDIELISVHSESFEGGENVLA
jgi:hypothetical protein